MLKNLEVILNIQDIDIKLIRLIRLRRQRQNELNQIESIKDELKNQLNIKKDELKNLNQEIFCLENKIEEKKEDLKKLEKKQSLVKKIEEFNALTKETTTIEREKTQLEQKTSNLLDKKLEEEELLEKIQEKLKASQTSSLELEKEIKKYIDNINSEGRELKNKRNDLIKNVDENLFKIYERLLKNKKDKVIVPIENKICNGCNITITLQHENLVKKGENLIFCEHCSRIHYWIENRIKDEEEKPKRKRRRFLK